MNIKKLVSFQLTKNIKKISTVTAVHPPGRFGNLDISNKNNIITSFNEKHQLTESWINGGFFVFKGEIIKKIFNYLNSSKTILELDPMKNFGTKKNTINCI